MLVDILRGSTRADLVSKGFHLIKTYGAGRDLGPAEWKAYLSQMLQLGLIEIAYNDGNRLKVTPQGMRVIRGEMKVTLARFLYERPETQSRKTKKAAPTNTYVNASLVSELKATRLNLAKIQGVAPYIICSDKTIQEIARLRPTDRESFSRIHGIGEYKTERLWEHFTRVVRRWMQQNPEIL